MIRVLLVDDSPLALHVVQRLLARAPDIQVVGTALDGQAALPMVAALAPDVICLDLHMPNMNGLSFTRAVMASHPCPILVVSISVEPGTPGVFTLLEAGAVDVLPKPRLLPDNDDERLASELIRKVRIVAGVKVFRRAPPPPAADPANAARHVLPHISAPSAPRLAVLGASTGGPQALRTILSGLPGGFALPLVCVQHIGAEFLSEMLAWLSQDTPLTLIKAGGGERPQSGHAYFAPENAHLEFERDGRLRLSRGPPCDGHRPSVTVSMNAAARQFGAATLGVLLTGMGRDGAAGMACIARAGGLTIAQDEASCVVFGMPGEAVAQGAAQYVLPLAQIAPALCKLVEAGAARRQ